MKCLQWILLGLAGLTACQVSPGPSSLPVYTPDIAITQAPYQEVHANWKQRLDQPYVYLEHAGDYRLAGKRFEGLHEMLEDQGLSASGPPFILFYDDPAQVELSQLRSRVCLPVATSVAVRQDLKYDVLPSTTVVYAVVEGPYPDVPKAYPGMYAYLARMHWVENGPIREIYLVRPSENGDWEQLLCEVQIPATQRR